MKENFESSFDFVLGWEGGYSLDPSDPGGETKYGISKRAFPSVDIAGLTQEQAKQIYFMEYWVKIGADDLPDKLDLLAFDSAVNLGVYATKNLLKLAGGDPYRFALERVAYYVDLANKKEFARKYFRGWINRTISGYRKVCEK